MSASEQVAVLALEDGAIFYGRALRRGGGDARVGGAARSSSPPG